MPIPIYERGVYLYFMIGALITFFFGGLASRIAQP